MSLLEKALEKYAHHESEVSDQELREVLEELGCLLIDRQQPFVVELPQRYMKGVLPPRQGLQRVDLEIEELLTSQSGGAHEKKRLVDGTASLSKLIL